jgi:hypothetical protein
MRYTRMILCLFAVVLSGCGATFNGYRLTPQTPAEILQGDRLDEDYPALEKKEKTRPKTISDTGALNPALSSGQTAVPLQPTEYRRVWVAPHKNPYGDAVHGHHCEVLFREAAFQAPRAPNLPPTAPVLVQKNAVQTPPGTGPSLSSGAVPPTHLQDYLQQMGIGNGQ